MKFIDDVYVGFLGLNRLGEGGISGGMEDRIRRLRCGFEEPKSAGREEEMPEDIGEDIIWAAGGDSEMAGRGCETGGDWGGAELWMCMEAEVEGLMMVGEVGGGVSKDVGSGDCGRVESCGVGAVVEVAKMGVGKKSAKGDGLLKGTPSIALGMLDNFMMTDAMIGLTTISPIDVLQFGREDMHADSTTFCSITLRVFQRIFAASKSNRCPG